jgi:DNA-binding response OmpR family regulator
VIVNPAKRARYTALIDVGSVYPEDLMRAGPVSVSPSIACTAWLDHRALPLGVRQVRILARLIAARGRLVSRSELYESLMQRPMPQGSRAIDMDVLRIRRALGPCGDHIRSVRKVGYALDVDALERLSTNRESFELSSDG